MEEQNLELEETLENPQEEGNPDADFKNQEYSASNDKGESENEVEKLKKINAQLYARLKKLEAKSKQEEKVVLKKDDSSWRIERLEFKVSHPELDSEHLDYLEALARGKGISLEEAYKMPIAQKAIQRDLEEKKLAEAISGGKAKSEEIKSLEQEAREAAKDPEKHKEFWKKVTSKPLSSLGE